RRRRGRALRRRGRCRGPARPTRTGWGLCRRGRRGSWAGASELAGGGPDGDVERVVEAGFGVYEPFDRADESPDRGGVAAGGAVAVCVGGLDRDLDAGLALDDDAVRAVAVRRLRPVGGAGRVDAGDVLDD